MIMVFPFLISFEHLIRKEFLVYIDAIFATQETLMNHLCDGGQPHLCFFDIKKALIQ